MTKTISISIDAAKRMYRGCKFHPTFSIKELPIQSSPLAQWLGGLEHSIYLNSPSQINSGFNYSNPLFFLGRVF